MAIMDTNYKTFINPGEIDFDKYVNQSDSGNYLFTFINEQMLSETSLDRAEVHSDHVWEPSIRGEFGLMSLHFRFPNKPFYKADNRTGTPFFTRDSNMNDFMCTICNLYRKDDEITNHVVDGRSVLNDVVTATMVSPYEFLKVPIARSDNTNITTIKEMIKKGSGNPDIIKENIDYEAMNNRDESLIYTCPVSSIMRIFFEVLVEGDFIFQRISITPNMGFTIYRTGMKYGNNDYRFSDWLGDGYESNATTLLDKNFSKVAMDKTFVRKDDVHKFFYSLVRWQGYEYNPNLCNDRGFYTYNGELSYAEFERLQKVYSPSTTWTFDSRRKTVTLTSNIMNHDTYIEEDINGIKYKLILQMCEILVNNSNIFFSHRIIKVREFGNSQGVIRQPFETSF